MMPVIASLVEITKAYPGILACHHVSIEFRSGEIHALLGENGAGKSTLVKILAGVIQPDGGTVEINNQAVRFSSPRDARRAGIGVVHQAGSLIETMTVADNLRLVKYGSHDRLDGSKPTPNVIFPLDVSADRFIGDLSPSEKRMVEVHRLLMEDVSLLVLDEPTASLSPQESKVLFNELRKLADAGYAVVVVSHKLPEIMAHSDRFTVLRKGEVVARLMPEETTSERIVELVTGAAIRLEGVDSILPHNQCVNTDLQLLRLRNIHTRRMSAHEAPLRDIDLVLQKGEMIGIAGRPGSGVATLVNLLYGEDINLTEGRIEWINHSFNTDHQRSVGLIPGNRLFGGVITSFTTAENLALRRRHLLNWKTGGKNSALYRFADELIQEYNVQPPNQTILVGALSGGNLQKVILAREIDYATDLLLAVNPIAGLDFASARFVYDSLRTKANTGTCVVIFSDDIDEFVGAVDRVIVVSRGRLVSELKGTEITREAIGLALAEVPANAQLIQKIDTEER